MPASLSDLLSQLELAGRTRKPGAGAKVAGLLRRLERAHFDAAPQLIQFHELLLFLRAYPHDRVVLGATEGLLASFHRRVESAAKLPGFDLPALVAPEVSGVAGTQLAIDWSYDVVRHLAARQPRRVEIDWEVPWNEPGLAAVLKLLAPLFQDAGYVEYPVPTRRWIERVRKQRQSSLAWLLERFDRLRLGEREKAALWNGLGLYVVWSLSAGAASRSRARIGGAPPFFHAGPLLRRSDVNLSHELVYGERLRLRRLSRRDGEQLLGEARDAMAVRSRELDGFTYGDPRTVRCAEAGRGVVFYLWGLPAERRLPLLAYHCGLMVKNQVPVGYFESLGFCERTEVGLNLFYSFRDGESAWIYARLLCFLRRHLGFSVFSVDPYQIGHANSEAIDSGAFWFYRKLGFRSVVPELEALARAEEARIAVRPGYRTSKARLKKLASGHVLLEAPSVPEPGLWDEFRIDRFGLAAERRGLQLTSDDPAAGLRVMLELIPHRERWSEGEGEALEEILRAKAGRDEIHYLRLLQRHGRLRRWVVGMGRGERAKGLAKD